VSSIRRKLPGRGWPRFLGEAVLDTGKKRLTVLFTHLSLSRDNHRMQIKYIAARTNEIDGPIILAGDFNVWNRHEIVIEGYRQETGFYKTYPSWNLKCVLIIFSKEFKLNEPSSHQ
jgi:endonuclease/exonuclease/phosphatase family metal-dependent hydrolase